MKDNPREPTVEYVEIDGNRAGQRLDNFLAGRLRGVPRPLIYRILRTGQVRVNKGRVKPGYKLEAGDIVRIPPVRRDEAPLLDNTGLQKVAQSLQRAVLLENAGFIVLNKPAGLAVHGGSGLRYGLIEVLKSTQGSYAGLELVHRLDRATSGCLLLAKTRSCLNQLHTLLREHKIEKHYTALLDGVIGKPLTIDTALVRRKQSGEHMIAVLENDEERNKTALTHIKPLRIYAGRTLADIQIETGRTHQIRVHCASIGHPLAGDEKYGHREFNKAMRGLSLRRLFLHAASLRFTLDRTYYIEAPLPEELAMVLDNLDA
jgi:23S rRNA pseudouridine955/2504/2580 synthase